MSLPSLHPLERASVCEVGADAAECEDGGEACGADRETAGAAGEAGDRWYVEMVGRGLRRSQAVEQLAARIGVDHQTVRRVLSRAERDLRRS